MSKYAGTQTEKNLRTAFSGESEARNKYTYFASVAKKEGYQQIAAIFEETANNEKEHAKLWFKLLHGGIGTTEENLKSAAEGENYEWTDMYEAFADPEVDIILNITRAYQHYDVTKAALMAGKHGYSEKAQ
mgnify:CR=1 FL=1